MAAKPNLERARRRIEGLMVDSCTIKRDLEQEADDALDTDTGRLVKPDPDDMYVYQGKCMVVPRGDYRTEENGGVVRAARSYDLFIPNGAPELEVGDEVRILSSVRDPRLVGDEFTVTDITTGTFTVAQQADLQRAGV